MPRRRARTRIAAVQKIVAAFAGQYHCLGCLALLSRYIQSDIAGMSLDRTDWKTKMQVRNTEAPIVEAMLIGGKPVDGRERIEVRNPARPEELVGTIVRGTPDHVDQAVAAAKSAQPAWAALSFVQRADVLRRALARLERDIDGRAAVFVRENGKPLVA